MVALTRIKRNAHLGVQRAVVSLQEDFEDVGYIEVTDVSNGKTGK